MEDKSKGFSTTTSLAYDACFNTLRATEYFRLDHEGHIYLDYTGGNLYAESQIKKHYDLLHRTVLGNPHSVNPSSQSATSLVEETRKKILDYFNAEDYFCIFTPNASGALKIVGENYPFCADSQYLLLTDNHNSVNGIREYCRRNGGDFEYSLIHYEDLNIDAALLKKQLAAFPGKKNKLFAYPAQSNVSGVKHSLEWISAAHDCGWDVLLDAAAYVPTNKLDLKKHQPDFVTVSFYKIFGYPTGLGCLLVKKTKFEKLDKKWFAGGTVTFVAVKSPHHYLTENHERFEDGTINYLGIPALKIGLEYIESIGIDKIHERVHSMISYLHHELSGLYHNTGFPQLHLFGPTNHPDKGSNMIMTFYNPDGSIVPFETIEALAAQKNISLRGGCFCNPGIDEVNSCITTEELSGFFSTRDKGNYEDMKHYLRKIRGALRVSVGIATVKKDLDAYISFVRSLKDQTLETTTP